MSTTLEQQLYQELENGNTKKALYIVKLMREDVNNLHRGKSPLVYAREFENEEVVNALTEKGAKEVVDADEVVKILLQDYDNAETIEERMKIAKLMNEFSELKGLTKVATSGHADVAKQMIVTGANVNNEDHRRSTVLIEAVKRGNVNVVEMLIRSEEHTSELQSP